MNLSQISAVVGNDVRRFEHSINEALRDGAHLLISLIESGKAANLATDVLHPAIADVAASLDTLASGQSKVCVGAHPKLAKVGGRLGLTVTDWGSSGPKAEDIAPVVAQPAEAVTASRHVAA